MAGTDSKIGVWDETTVEGQPYWHSTGIEDRLPTTEAPEAPSGLAVTPGSTTAALTWDAVTGADSIALYRRDDTAMGSFALVTDEIAGNATSYNDTGLTPENEYSWYITATNEAGTSDPSSTVTDTTLAAESATLIFQETFEGTLQTGSVLTNGAQVAAHAGAMSGTNAVRINLKDGVSDPFGVTGANSQTYEYQGTLIRDSEALIHTIMWDFRIDDAWWKGSGFSNPSSSSVRINMKGGYFGPFGNASAGFFPVFDGGPDGEINIGSNYSTSWVNDPWVNDPGRQLWYMTTGHQWGSDGLTHTFKLEIDSTHEDYHTWTMWIDGVLATNDSYAPDGKIRLPKACLFENFSTSYTNDTQVDTSEDRTGTACGMWVDNVRIYQGVVE